MLLITLSTIYIYVYVHEYFIVSDFRFSNIENAIDIDNFDITTKYQGQLVFGLVHIIVLFLICEIEFLHLLIQLKWLFYKINIYALSKILLQIKASFIYFID